MNIEKTGFSGIEMRAYIEVMNHSLTSLLYISVIRACLFDYGFFVRLILSIAATFAN
jgi:hypothetical protein